MKKLCCLLLSAALLLLAGCGAAARCTSRAILPWNAAARIHYMIKAVSLPRERNGFSLSKNAVLV